MAMNFAVLWIAVVLIVACMAEARVGVQQTNLPRLANFDNVHGVHGVNQFGGEKSGTNQAGSNKIGGVKVIPNIHKRKLLSPTFKTRGKKGCGQRGRRQTS